MPESANVIVARTQITDKVTMSAEAPESLMLQAGTTIHLKFPFTFREVNKDRDWFQIKLRAGFGEDLRENVLNHKDVFGKADDKRGFIDVKVDAPDASAPLRYEAIVTYGSGEWGSAEHKVVDEGLVEGSIDIQVA